MTRKYYIGQEFYNKFNEKAIIIGYKNSDQITIKSTNGYIREVKYQHLIDKA